MKISRGFDRAAESLPVGILRTDVTGRCLFINRAAREILGMSEAEARDEGWRRDLSPDDRDAVLRLWKAPVDGGGDRSVEIVVRPDGGEPRTISLRASPIRGPGDATTGHAIVLVDVTEWLRAALELRRSAREIEERLRASERDLRDRLTHLTRISTVGEMASGIAHEVNQPLTAVATYAQACRRLIEAGEVGLADVQDVLERIAREALRAGDIIHHLRDMVRRHESRWREVDLNELVRDVAQLAEVDAGQHDVLLSFDLTPDLPPVLADGVQVQQVVLNLIRNGIDAVGEAGPERREVRVRTGTDGPGSLRVSVEDEGGGVPAEVERQLFHPFFTTKKGGMGMGLSISRSIVTAHQGRIGFERRPGGGSTFFFTLPVLDELVGRDP
jgi:two-component system sensor kinase FixL